MIRRAERLRLLRPMMRLAARLDRTDDPWVCVAHRGPMQLLGDGSTNPFGWYFEGESGVATPTFRHVCDFLLGCQYVSDLELFRQDEFWQHPLTFEQIRKGDCEDHALWAWRKLRELGLPAHLVTGSCQLFKEEPRGHAFVIFEARGRLYLFETAAKRRRGMVQPLDALRAVYRPHASIDHGGTMYVYGGMVADAAEWRARKRSRRPREAPGSESRPPSNGFGAGA